MAERTLAAGEGGLGEETLVLAKEKAEEVRTRLAVESEDADENDEGGGALGPPDEVLRNWELGNCALVSDVAVDLVGVSSLSTVSVMERDGKALARLGMVSAALLSGDVAIERTLECLGDSCETGIDVMLSTTSANQLVLVKRGPDNIRIWLRQVGKPGVWSAPLVGAEHIKFVVYGKHTAVFVGEDLRTKDGVATAIAVRLEDGALLSRFELPRVLGSNTTTACRLLRFQFKVRDSSRDLVGVWPDPVEHDVAVVRIFGLDDGREKAAWSVPVGQKLSMSPNSVCTCLLPFDRMMFSLGGMTFPVSVDLNNGETFVLVDHEEPNFAPLAGSVRCIVANHKFVAVGLAWFRHCKNHTLKIFDAESGVCIFRLGASAETVALQLHPDLPHILVSASKSESRLRVWNIQTGEALYNLNLNSSIAGSFALSKRFLACLSGSRKGGNPATKLHIFDFEETVASADGSSIHFGKVQRPRKRRNRGPDL